MRTYYNLVDDAYNLIKESRTNSATSVSEMKDFVNQGYQFIAQGRGWNFLQKEGELEFVSTQLSEDVSAGKTTLTVDSVSGFMIGQKVMIYADEETYEECVIAGINTADSEITLRDSLLNDYSEDDYLISYSNFLPHDCRTVLKVWVEDDPQGNYSFKILENFTPKDFVDEKGDFIVSSQPQAYILGGMDLTRMPSSGTYTAQNDSEETFIIQDNPALEDGHFDGWVLINHTHQGADRVSSYTSDIFYLEKGIEDQTEADTFHLERRKTEILIYPVPQYSANIKFQYIRSVSDLLNDYDTPVFPDQYHYLISLYAGIQALAKDESRAKTKEMREAQFNQGISRMIRECKIQKDKPATFKPDRGFCV